MPSVNPILLYPWEGIHHYSLNGDVLDAATTSLDIGSVNDGVGIQIFLKAATTIDFFEIWLDAGTAADSFRCRITTPDTTSTPYGQPSTNLAHANADLTLSSKGGSAGWVKFDFTNFELAAGYYTIILTASSAGAFDLNLTNMADYNRIGDGGHDSDRLFVWNGTTWDNSNVGTTKARLKATTGYLQANTMAPQGSDIRAIMDTAENPSCVGNQFIAPWTGDIVGVAYSFPGFTADTSARFVLSDSTCTTILSSTEQFEGQQHSPVGAGDIRLPAASVTAGTTYAIYVTAGSKATGIGGISAVRLNFTSDNNLSECYGITSGDLKGMTVHQPPSEGGVGTVTASSNGIWLMTPIYDAASIVTTGGGSSEHSWSG